MMLRWIWLAPHPTHQPPDQLVGTKLIVGEAWGCLSA
jgi:hypothetical protein